MTHFPDDPKRDAHRDAAGEPVHDEPVEVPSDPEAAFDEDAMWREIIENYGERPVMGPEEPPAPAAPQPERSVFDRTFVDSMNSEATWEDEGHFVPPEPPPLPHVDPRRKLAWGGLLGGPLLLLVAVVFGIGYPTWLTGMLVAAFVGGFVYLVATMPRSGHGDWPGDDGAVV